MDEHWIATRDELPERVGDLPDFPSTVRVKGRLPDLSNPTAVVGSRSATQYGMHMAHAVVSAETSTIITGGAFGIDAAATRRALDLGLDVVLVVACGVNRVYPAAHRSLFHQVLEAGGAIISERDDPWASPNRTAFLARNRLICALARKVVLVEAVERSGSSQAVRWATTLNRDLYAVPGPVTSPQSAVPHQLIASGDARIWIPTGGAHTWLGMS